MFNTTLVESSSQTSTDWPKPSTPTTCTKTWLVAICGAKVRRFEIGCHKGSCWVCEDDLRQRGALAVKGRFTPHLRGRDVRYDVLTVPEHRRLAAADWKTWAKWTKAIMAYLQGKLGMVWAVVRTDPAGKCRDAEVSGLYCDCSKCSKWHPHLNVLWVRKGSGWLSETQLLDLKLEWARIIGAEIIWKDDAPFPIVNVWGDYAKDPGSTKDREEKARREGYLWHLYSYMARKWPAWQKSARRYLWIRWYGKYPTKPLSEEASEKKLTRLYADLAELEAAGNTKKVKRVQRSIDRLRKPAPCRCGCDVTYYPEPANCCKCCGERIETMDVLDEEEAAHWEQEGPEAALAELRRRRREGLIVFKRPEREEAA